MPRTRSMANQSSGTSGSRKARDRATKGERSDAEDGEYPALQRIQGYLAKVQNELPALEGQVLALQKKNQELEEELERANDKAETSNAGGGNRANTARMETLERTVNELKAMKDKEIKEEARDLLDTEPDAMTGEDPVHRMRKLLRRFNDLMLVTTLGDGDECPICMERMVPKETSAFDCQHLVCNECFKGILPDASENYPCPVCRKKTAREEMELVTMTEQERWDALLLVAEAWAAADHRPEMDTSEEEEENDMFVPDGATTSEPDIAEEEEEEEGPEQDGYTEGEVVKEEEEEDDSEGPSSPQAGPSNHRSYAESPVKEKRKRLAELAEERASRKQRRC
ncbi:hypothetical protein FA15DRAFT_681719 [Coprinopsis marcescibilis]|uniref:RING-type domain-containing protein n=1 Tax=Coprinopsis marcescibilis TaxID=230819 RepID=A0A5C3L293_COPMA|nr:hypothetical protein FA15DRAFT_681719 [Coprinopsis marcescibilis]